MARRPGQLRLAAWIGPLGEFQPSCWSLDECISVEKSRHVVKVGRLQLHTRLIARTLNRPRLKYHMDYCMEHPEELSRVAGLQKKVDEVKNVMVDNIEQASDASLLSFMHP